MRETDGPSETDGPIETHAAGAHCGVCVHVTFQDDWDRTPYCTYHQQVVEIPGEVCSAFER